MDGSESSGDHTTPPPGLRELGTSRVIGLVGWAVIFGAFLVWEGLGLTVGHQWPTLSHMLRTVTRTLPGRLILFGLWLWLGWHLFIRGWNFFLRGPLPEPPAPASGGGLSLAQMWQRAIVPLTGTYALFLTMLAISARRPPSPGEDAPEPSPRFGSRTWARRFLGIFLTISGGYVLFVAMIGAYVAASASNPEDLLRHAIEGGAVLAFGVVLPGFTILSAAAGVSRHVRRGRDALP